MLRRTGATAPRALLIGVALLALFGFTLSRATVATAQDASPVAGACDAPALPPGSPTPMEDMASPMAGHDMSQMASPEAQEIPEFEATPVEEAAPVGTPADQATADEVTAAITNIVGCLNSGNYEGFLALFTPDGVMHLFGTSNPYDIIAGGFLEGTMFNDLVVSDVETYADGSVSARVDYIEGQYQAVSERLFLVEEEGYWKVDGSEFLTPQPEGDTAVVGVTLGGEAGEYTFTPNVSSVVQSEVLVLHGINNGAEPHEIAVVRLPEGMTSEDVLAAATDEAAMAELEAQVEFIGAAFFEPGEQGDLALVGLEPGVYTLVCFVPDPSGVPHIVHGMVTQITVTAPEPVEPVASPAA